jgi:hypothetical protein
MQKLIGVFLGFVLSVALCATNVAYAQPEQEPKTPGAGEKADTGETLQKGAEAERPWAVGVSMELQRTALAKFREANDLLNQGLFVRASEGYKQALKSWQHPAIHYNLALALMQADQPIEAYESLEKAIIYGDAPLDKDKFEHAKEYMLLLEKQIASVEVSCDKAGAKVSVDGKEVFVAPGTYKARVRIGKHTFVAEKQGYTTRINAPFIGPSEKFRIELKLYTSEELTRYNRRWQATWMPYVVLGVGVGLLGAGAALELSASSSYDDYDQQVAACNMNNLGCPTSDDLRAARDSGDTKKNLGYVMYGVGGATIAAGVVLAILNRPKAYQIRPEDLQEQQAPKVSITPVITPNLAGAMVQGRF